MEKNKIKVSLIDLYNNEKNLEIDCIRKILFEVSLRFEKSSLDYEISNTRHTGEAPAADYDIYISSGGPGSPWDGEGSRWEANYFSLLDALLDHNQKDERKKYIFFICHSFQLMVRYFKLGAVTKRNSESFGVFAACKTEAGKTDPLFNSLPDPFYCADFRNWQVVNPDTKKINDLGASILTLENNIINQEKGSAITSLRISNEIAGTQFHPETDEITMRRILSQKKKKEELKILHGADKFEEMIRLTEAKDGLSLTHKTVLPGFLMRAIKELNENSY